MGRKKKDSINIEDLPDSDSDIDSRELAVLNGILNINKDNTEYSRLQLTMYATMIFALLSLPFTDRIIELAAPIASSWLILVGIKIVIFFMLFYIIVYSIRENR